MSLFSTPLQTPRNDPDKFIFGAVHFDKDSTNINKLVVQFQTSDSYTIEITQKTNDLSLFKNDKIKKMAHFIRNLTTETDLNVLGNKCRELYNEIEDIESFILTDVKGTEINLVEEANAKKEEEEIEKAMKKTEAAKEAESEAIKAVTEAEAEVKKAATEAEAAATEAKAAEAEVEKAAAAAAEAEAEAAAAAAAAAAAEAEVKKAAAAAKTNDVSDNQEALDTEVNRTNTALHEAQAQAQKKTTEAVNANKTMVGANEANTKLKNIVEEATKVRKEAEAKLQEKTKEAEEATKVRKEAEAEAKIANAKPKTGDAIQGVNTEETLDEVGGQNSGFVLKQGFGRQTNSNQFGKITAFGRQYVGSNQIPKNNSSELSHEGSSVHDNVILGGRKQKNTKTRRQHYVLAPSKRRTRSSFKKP
jgi:DNA repair exonuclease SbcCD ATPase subunit